ncbi:MAG: hypothetical protein Q9216_004058 [Gyalolechia sp. 2 TL-2023]
MSVQTRVMADGRWTTRTLDIHQILARNRQEKSVMQNLATGPIPPTLGLLTKTLVGSPIITAIIPARVRHRSKNDVIFVYKDAVVIKEVLGGERIEDDPFTNISLDNIDIKKDFGSSILAAKIMGLPRKPKVPRFPGRFWDGDYKPQSPLETKPEPFQDNEIPPQILVLSLASRILVFLFAYYDLHDAVHFVSSTWPLPAQILPDEELGVHIAIDPHSRAMAVGAKGNRVTFYALKSRERLRNEVQGPDGMNAAKFMPVQEEKHTEVDGSILKMDFLHPSKGDENHVILLLVVSKGPKTRLVRIEWDCRSSLDEIDQKPGQVLSHPERLPLLLIPLTYGTAFALVCEDQIVVYKNLLTGIATGQSCALEHYEPPEEPGSSNGLPTWTQWARPMRPVDRRKPNMDNIYLCRGDGVVRYIDIREDSDPMICSSYNAGILNANVGNAFATLDLGEESNDLLVAAGELGDGGIWYFKPREPLHLVGTIRNWTPLGDLATVQGVPLPRNLTRNNIVTTTDTGRIFACSGRGPRNGAIVEIRVGTEAVKLGPTIDIEELVEKGIDKIWALPDQSNIGIYLMISHPTATELILLPSANDQDPQLSSNIEELDLEVKTIAAGSTAEGSIIQVTPTSINAIAQEHGILPYTSNLNNATITAACFLTIPMRTTVLLTVVQKDDGFYLHHGHFGCQNGQIAFAELGEPILLRSEASVVSVHWVNDRIIAFVGTLAGTVQSYTAKPGSSFVPYFEYSFEDDFAVCDSLAMITTTNEISDVEMNVLLVCGLRDGTIQTLLFNGNDFGESMCYLKTEYGLADLRTDATLSLCEKIEIGTTSVQVMTDATRNSRVIFECERKLYTLEYFQHPSSTNPAIINKIWLTDPSTLASRQYPLDCFTQGSSQVPQGYSKFGAGSLFYLSGSNLLLADLNSSPGLEMVPQRLALTGTPTRMIYSDRLNKLIVLYVNITPKTFSPAGSRRHVSQPRTSKPALAFVALDIGGLRPVLGGIDNNLNVLEAIHVKAGERFLGITEWFPRDGNTHYHILVINTVIKPAASEESAGRLLMFGTGTKEDGQVFADPKKLIDHDAPVWCVAPYGDSSLVYACGDKLVLQTLNMARGRFDPEITATLHCPATYISVDEEFIHVSTRGSGHHIFRIDDGTLVSVCADASGQSEIHHLTLSEKSMVVTSDVEGRVAGLWQPPEPQLSRTAPLIFEARLPSWIRRFCKLARPVWQRKFPHLESQAIVGSSEDGGLYQMTVLSEPAWRLLAFVQNMAMREARICPYPHPSIQEKHIEPSTAKKQNMHIDGDVLTRLLERGGASLVEEMLRKEPSRDFSQSDYATAEDRGQRFEELVKDFFQGQVDDSIETTLELIRSLLLPAI